MRLNLYRRIRALCSQSRLRSYQRPNLHQVSNDSRPTCLMAGTKSRSILSMEVLMELNQVFPVGIVLKLFHALHAAIYRTLPLLVTQKDFGEPVIELLRNLIQRHHLPRTRRTLNLKVISVELVELI